MILRVSNLIKYYSMILRVSNLIKYYIISYNIVCKFIKYLVEKSYDLYELSFKKKFIFIYIYIYIYLYLFIYISIYFFCIKSSSS